MTEETPKTPADLAREAAEDVQRDLRNLREAASMSSLANAIAELDSHLANLGPEIAELRTAGYAFKAYLERKAQVLADQWREAEPAAQASLQSASRDLCYDVDRLDGEFRGIQNEMAADPDRCRQQLEALARSVELLSSKVNGEQSRIRALYEKIAQNADQTKAQVEDARDCLKTVAEAGFKLYPTEDAVDAVKAQWLQDGKNGPKGILIVTDARVLFEQREDVAAAKVLFITTKKERVQKLLIDVPVGATEKVAESESGALLWHKELLDLSFAEGQPLRHAQLKLDEDSAAWAALINRVASGDIDKERVTAKAAAPAPAKPVPTKCPTCSANLDTPVVKGMQSMKCPYCGTVIALS